MLKPPTTQQESVVDRRNNKDACEYDDNYYANKTISMLPQNGEEEMWDSAPHKPMTRAPVTAMDDCCHERDDVFKSTTDPQYQPQYKPSSVFSQSHFYRLPKPVPRQEEKGWFASLFGKKGN